MKAKYVLREVMKYLQDNKDSKVLVKDNKDLLQYIQVLKKLPDVKERDNPYIYKPTVEVPAPKKYRDWSVQEVYKDLKEKNNE
tara:strand:- start:650 stop:898 length:249 start_codon:yes stop_codon:yes gene_type:complete